jgi:tetratricopeptide (TPR) repeat protein
MKIINKYLTASLVLMAFAGWGSALRAQDVPDLPPVASSDPAVQAQQEREQFVKEIRRVEGLNRKYTKQIDEIKELLAEKDADFQNRMKKLEDKLAAQKDEGAKVAVAKEQEQQTARELEAATNEMLSKGGDLDPEDEQFKVELAKAHYNMGNLYYERGEYQRALVEYYQAADLAPNDPDVHYNLAFVSGEFLGDQETALKHYQWYIYLKPDADDKKLVEEKMLQAKLHMRSKIDSDLDKDNGHYNLTR